MSEKEMPEQHMKKARELTEKARKAEDGIAKAHEKIATQQMAHAELDEQIAKMAEEQQRMLEMRSAMEVEAHGYEQNIAVQQGRIIEGNIALTEMQVAYGAFSAITNSFANLVVSASIIASLVFVPISLGSSLNNVNGPLARCIFLLSCLSLVVLLYCIFVATQAITVGTKHVYQTNAKEGRACSDIWTAVGTLVDLQDDVIFSYFSGTALLYALICLMCWASLEQSMNTTDGNQYNQKDGLQWEDYLTGTVCTLFSFIFPVIFVYRAKKYVDSSFELDMQNANSQRSGKAGPGPGNITGTSGDKRLTRFSQMGPQEVFSLRESDAEFRGSQSFSFSNRPSLAGGASETQTDRMAESQAEATTPAVNPVKDASPVNQPAPETVTKRRATNFNDMQSDMRESDEPGYVAQV